MEFRSPPSSTRRNPPRRAKAVAAGGGLPWAPRSHKKRVQPSKPLADPPPFSSEEISAKIEEERPLQNVSGPPPVEHDPSNPSAEENGPPQESTSDNPEFSALQKQANGDLQPSGNPANNEDVKNLQVFLRIRPAKVVKEVRKSIIGIPRGPSQKRKTQILHREDVISKTEHICLCANDSHSVTLTAPPSLFDSKRTKIEVYTGFAHVFLPDSSQEDVYETVMHSLVKDFMEGKSCLLVAMGPTSSGKTHTLFGSPKEPGLIPRVLKNILASDDGNTLKISRSYFISMFEIYSERGRGERIIDLFQGGAELNLQQSNIKGLQEVEVSSVEEAESLLTQGMQKRTTAATNANSQSSRSQCIINVRSTPKVVNCEGNHMKLAEAVLTIADLAGAEREKKTGNQGVRFGESNFINNTSMVFGQCLRALLEHQKNPKRALEKHYLNSLLTRYLKDYLEAKGRMVMVLNVSPGEENYVDTAFVLRQASPYVNIKFNSQLEESSSVQQLKRSSSILSKGVLPKRKKFRHSSIEHVNHGNALLVHHSLGEVKADKAISEDSVVFFKERNSCSSMSSENGLGQGKDKSCIKDSSVLTFTEEELKERISVEVARALQHEGQESHERLMAAYTDTLSNVLKEHKIKVKMMEEQVQTLEEKLQVENKRSLELSDRVKFLMERCADLELQNEQLQLSNNSTNLISDTDSRSDPDKRPVVLEGFGCQNNHINEDVIISERTKDTLLVSESETAKGGNDVKEGEVCDTLQKKEQICARVVRKESDKGNLDKVSQIDDKDCFPGLQTLESSSADSLITAGMTNVQRGNMLQLCQDQVCLSDCLETVEIGTCQGRKENAAFESHVCFSGCGCQNDYTNVEGLFIRKINAPAMMVLDNKTATDVSGSLARGDNSEEKERICVTAEEKESIKENLILFLQNGSNIRQENLSAVSTSESLSGLFLENDEENTQERRNEILLHEDQVCLSGELDIAAQWKEIMTVGSKQVDDAIPTGELDIAAHGKEIMRVGSKQVDHVIPTGIKSAITLEAKEDVMLNTNISPDESCVELSIPETNSSSLLASKFSLAYDPGARSNLEKGRMLASFLVKGKPEEEVTDININGAEGPEESKVISEAYTTSEDDFGPIGQCLEELLGLSPCEIEDGLWKDNNECKQKISILLERHGGVLDLSLFNKNYYLQRSLCIRYCFSLICKKANIDKHWVSLSEDIDEESRHDMFLAVVKARTVGKAACYARQGLQQEGLFQNSDQSLVSQGRHVEFQTSQADTGNSNKATFPSNPSTRKNICCLESEKENLFSLVGTPKRKLLPASPMLLTGIDDDATEDEITKVYMNCSWALCFDKVKRSDASVGLLIGRFHLVKMLVQKEWWEPEEGCHLLDC